MASLAAVSHFFFRFKNCFKIKDYLLKRRVNVAALVEKADLLSTYDKELNTSGVRHRYITKIASLNTIVNTNSTTPEAAVFVFHGFGANKEDLEDVGQFINRACGDKKTVLFFPDAPIDMGYGSFAWWHINIAKLQEQAARHDVSGIKRAKAQGMDEARAATLNFIETALKNFNISEDRVALCGFSQGAMLSMDMTMHLPTPPKALGLFSSVVTAESDWIAKYEEADDARRSAWKNMKVTQSHGTEDMIIPVEGGNTMGEWVEKRLNAQRNYIEFRGPHTLSPQACMQFAQDCKDI